MSKLHLYTVKYTMSIDVEAHSDIQAVNRADNLLHEMTAEQLRELVEGVSVDYQCTGIQKEEA